MSNTEILTKYLNELSRQVISENHEDLTEVFKAAVESSKDDDVLFNVFYAAIYQSVSLSTCLIVKYLSDLGIAADVSEETLRRKLLHSRPDSEPH